MQNYEIHKNKANLIIGFVPSLIFSICGFVLFFNVPDFASKTISLAIGFGFGLFTYLIFKKIKASSVTIRFEPEHLVYLDISKHAVQFPWKEIKGFYLYSFQKQLFLGFILEDEEKYIQSLPSFQRLVLKANQKLGFPAFNVALNQLKNKEEALKAFEKTNIPIYTNK